MNDWLKPYYQAALSPAGKVVVVKVNWNYCKRCGRMLKTAEARERGYGKICWEKQQNSNQSSLF